LEVLKKIIDTYINDHEKGKQDMQNPMFFFIHFISSMTPMFIHPYSSLTAKKSKFQAIL